MMIMAMTMTTTMNYRYTFQNYSWKNKLSITELKTSWRISCHAQLLAILCRISVVHGYIIGPKMAIVQDDFRGFPQPTKATSLKQATTTSSDINIHTS